MGGLLSTPMTELRSGSLVSQQQVAYLLDLPPEIILEATSYLPKDELKNLRGVCKYLDATLLATFGSHYFSRVHLMPTHTSLDILTQISTQGRLSAHVRELCICSSVYQFWGVQQTRFRPGVRYTKPQLRVLSETERPFSDPLSLEQKVANACAELVRGGQFRKQLTTALQSLRVERIEVQKWPKPNPSLALGLSELVKTTGRNPFVDNFSGILPAWEYETINMVTRMTEIVFSAVNDSGTPLFAMIVDRIQIDQLVLAPNFGCNLSHLNHLEISIALSDPSIQFSDQTRRFDLFTLINELPCLEHLYLSNCPYKENWTPLNHALTHIHPQKVRKIRLGLLWDAVPQVVQFLKHSVPSLRDLELRFTKHKDGNKPWNEMFSALRGVVFSLERLYIDVDSHIFEAYAKDDMEFTLVWLAENMPDHWKGFKDEDDSEDEEEGEEEEGEYHRGPGPISRKKGNIGYKLYVK